MAPHKIILIRHGESMANIDANVYAQMPDHRIPLSAAGVEQAREAGKAIQKIIGAEQTVRVYLSPHRRTQETAAGLLEAFDPRQVLNVYQDPRLREQDRGHCRPVQESVVVDAERKRYGAFYYRFPHGESGADVFDRVTTFLDTLHRDFLATAAADNYLIVTHGLAMRLFLMRWFHWTVDYFERLSNPRNCQFFIMERQENGRYQLTTPMRVSEGAASDPFG